MKSINSIINQTYKDFELIIVDDGSSDGSEKLCDEFAQKDQRIKVIHLKNSGVSNARNVGLDNAKGKYIQFIDSDDYVDEDMLEKLYGKATQYDVDIVISGITKVNHNYEVLNKTLPKLIGVKSKNEMLENFSAEQRSTGIYGCVSNKFIKRDIVEKIKLRFDTKIKLAEDLDFYLKLYEHISSIYFYDTSFYYYIQNAANSSTSEDFKHDYLTQINISLRQKDLLSKNNMLNENNLKTINLVITNFTLCYIYDKFDYSYHILKEKCKKIYSNKLNLNSITYENQSKYNQIIIFLIKHKFNIMIYLTIFNKNIIKKIYKKFKPIYK